VTRPSVREPAGRRARHAVAHDPPDAAERSQVDERVLPHHEQVGPLPDLDRPDLDSRPPLSRLEELVA